MTETNYIVGFDIGHDTSVVAVAKFQTVDVLLNDVSKHETPSVGFEAASMAITDPAQIKRIIGKGYRCPGIKEELRELPYSTSEDDEDGGILISVEHDGEYMDFTPVEILAMLLSNLMRMVERRVGIPGSHFVVAVPSYFTDSERLAYRAALASASTEGSRMRLMHEGTAIALAYGFYKTEMKNRTAVVVFVDVDHCHTQVTVVKFFHQRMQVLWHAILEGGILIGFCSITFLRRLRKSVRSFLVVVV